MNHPFPRDGVKGLCKLISMCCFQFYYRNPSFNILKIQAGANKYLLILTFCQIPCQFLSQHLILAGAYYKWLLKSTDLNCVGQLIYRFFFSIVNATVLHDPTLFEFVDMEEPQMWRAEYKLYMDFQLCEGPVSLTLCFSRVIQLYFQFYL